MRIQYLLSSTILLLAILLAACGSQATPAPGAAIPLITEMVPTAATVVQSLGVEDLNSLIVALGAAGVMVEHGGAVEQPFFTAPGQVITVNGEDMQVYTFETSEALEAEATQVAADASTIGTNMPTWEDAPHFFKTGRMLVLYVGQNQKILDLLAGAFGPQFAGR